MQSLGKEGGETYFTQWGVFYGYPQVRFTNCDKKNFKKAGCKVHFAVSSFAPTV